MQCSTNTLHAPTPTCMNIEHCSIFKSTADLAGKNARLCKMFRVCAVCVLLTMTKRWCHNISSWWTISSIVYLAETELVCCIWRCLAVCGSCAVTAGDRGAVSHVSRNPGTSSASTQPPPVELPTSLREDFTITEKAPTWAFS